MALTGGATLVFAGCVPGGASVGAAATTGGMVESDRGTGYSRSWQEFGVGLLGGIIAGGITGAILYGTVVAALAAGTLAGMDAAYYLGTSVFMQCVVPSVVKTGVYGLAAATGIYTSNDR